MKQYKSRSCYFWKIELCMAFVFLFAIYIAKAEDNQNPDLSNQMIVNAQTIDYCEVIGHPEKFNNQMIRIRALYEVDFENSELTSPFCELRIPTTWLTFEDRWEHRSKWRVRHDLAHMAWRNPKDVVLIGVFKSGSHYGHMDMYLFSFEVYKVEVVRGLGRFRSLP